VIQVTMPPEIDTAKAVVSSDVSYSTVEGIEKTDVEAHSTWRASESRAPVTLEWADLTYAVSDKVTKQQKTLLHKMCGKATPGKLLGIMGTSGAGKSTLLDCLAGRISGQDISGTIKVNGSVMDPESFKRMSGFVMQSDALFPLLTVRETIRYAAHLRCANKSNTERNAIADNVLSMLKLDKCAETIVGDDQTRGLSGGEKRRVSIAVDMVNSPGVLFLDEPTSGLDSSTALSVVQSLKDLASKGCTIVMTIHQPSARLFQLLDDVIFLSNGQITYNGPVSELRFHTDKAFEVSGHANPSEGNLPEIMLDLCDSLIAENRLSILTSKYQSTSTTSDQHQNNTNNEVVPSVVYANSFLQEVGILSSRAFKNVLRTPELFVARLGASLGFGVLLGTLFLDTKDDLLGLQHRLSYFVFCCAFYFYTSLEALPLFLAEREIFQREFSRGAYRASAYTIAQSITTMPAYVVVSSIFTVLTWWLVGLPNDAGVFFFQILTVFTIMMAGNAFATLISTLVPNPMAGQSAGSALLSVMFLFSGFFIKSKDIPDYWIWLHYLSLFKYAFDSLIVNDLNGVVVKAAGAVVMDHDQVLDYFSVKGIDRGRGIWCLWLFILGFRLIFCYRLRTAFSGQRK